MGNIEAGKPNSDPMQPTETGLAVQIQPPETGDGARNTPKTRAEIGVHLLQALLPMSSTMANGPMSLAQESGARAPLGPKLKVQGQTVVAGQPSHERIETRELKPENSRPENQGAKANKSRLGSQGQEVRAKESEPNRAKKANTREKVVAGQPDNPSTESGPKNPSFLREVEGRPERESRPDSQDQKLKDSKSKTATQGQKRESR